MAEAKLCAVHGCGKPYHSRGYCRNHAHRDRNYGDPLRGPTSNGEPLAWLRAHVSHNGDGCLIWPFARRDGEYGRLYLEGRRKQVYAHQLMCAAAHGAAPTDHHEVAHNCGNGQVGCVHPQHLRWDTTAGNAADRKEHGTENIGERNGQAKLTTKDVRRIRKLLGRASQANIAEMFNVSRSAISDIACGRRWGSVV